ncbi:MAG: protein YgfX [Gammaproteobacteria bacterium]
MSVKYATPLHLEFKSSKLFGFYVCAVFLITLFCIYLLPVIPVIKMVLLPICALACIQAYKAHNHIRSVIWQEDNHWLLHYAKDTVSAELTDTGFANAWLVILHFKTETGSSCSRLICYDSLDRTVFRQLKVRLKVEGAKHRHHAKMNT